MAFTSTRLTHAQLIEAQNWYLRSKAYSEALARINNLNFTRKKKRKPQRLQTESPVLRLPVLPTAWQPSSRDRFRAGR
ncbi:MAG: hypothetical protein OXI01_03425, partial [Albidovulum sp.]|nr:hypothetical protein [Albidovulum sp.]